MPSWNIHTAHVERLLKEGPLDAWGIQDANAFLFGNLVPDIYVGYMVPDASRRIEYKDTHFADPEFIPAPDAARFYELYARETTDDLVVGAWTHLLCDHYYNLRTSEYIASIGVLPGERTRIRKQADFDLFGRTFDISAVPEVTDGLLDSCASFPQYPIGRDDVLASVRAQAAVVERNQREHVDGTPAYDLLTADFFQRTFSEVDAVLRKSLRAHRNHRLGAPEIPS